MTADIWRHLGIAKTASEADIRRAYAERLRATNPEDDPEGFKRLRSAYERAMQQARWAHYEEDVEEYDDEPWDEADGEPLAASLEPLHPDQAYGRDHAPEAELPPLDPELAAHEESKRALQQAVAHGAAPEAVQAAFKAVVSSPAMLQLRVYAGTEMWVASLIRAHRAVDVLFDCAAAHFKWSDRGRPHDLGPSMLSFRTWVQEDAKVREFIARIGDRRHEFYDAYQETKLSPKPRNWLSRLLSFPRIDLVRRFLDYVDDKAPYAYNELDFAATQWWRKRINYWLTPLSVLSRILPVAVVIAVIAMFGIFSSVETEQGEHWARAGGRSACARSVEPDAIDRQQCDQYLEAAPDSLLMRQYAGIVALRQERWEQAREHFEQIMRASPLDPAARYGAGLALLRSENAARRLEGRALMRGALALDDTVSVYFAQYGATSPETLDPDAAEAEVQWAQGERFDRPPGGIALEAGDDPFGRVYDHFGIRDHFEDGRVVVHCLVRATGRIGDCQIVEETPRNTGRGEVALRVMESARATPATFNGELVDGAAIRVPVTFRVR